MTTHPLEFDMYYSLSCLASPAALAAAAHGQATSRSTAAQGNPVLYTDADDSRRRRKDKGCRSIEGAPRCRWCRHRRARPATPRDGARRHRGACASTKATQRARDSRCAAKVLETELREAEAAPRAESRKEGLP
jgi:hypothetical protein